MSVVGRPITFREYVQRVVGDPRRADEMKILVELFSMPVLEKVLEGKINIQPKNFMGVQ